MFFKEFKLFKCGASLFVLGVHSSRDMVMPLRPLLTVSLAVCCPNKTLDVPPLRLTTLTLACCFSLDLSFRPALLLEGRLLYFCNFSKSFCYCF
jgi:hypothetical protein